LVAGALGTIAFPIWMRRTREPLVPLGLFRSRNFTVTNLSTFVIYGALYVSFTFQGLFLIGTMGYTEPAAGLAGLPSILLLTFFSTRFGRLAARYGPRIFMAIGPALMGLGLLWFLRIPAGSEPWTLGSGQGSFLPPADYFADVFPAMVVFGVGLMMMVAPLTTALMTSVPERNSGVASAINNAISRVGAPLVGALIFVAVASSFYGSVQERAPEAARNEDFKTRVAPLNPPPPDAGPGLQTVIREASTEAFRLAMAVASALLLAGAAVNAVGINNQIATPEPGPDPVPAPG
jgi:Na+/melibiose symporter-like transporter